MSVKRVSQTGQAKFSQDTQDMLKLMMKESKLTNYQQRVLKSRMSEGSALPTRVNPNHSEDGPSMKKKVVKPKVNKNRRGVKSHQDIQADIAADTSEPYRPAVPKYNSTVEKERLTEIMTYGEEGLPVIVKAAPLPPQPAVERFDEIIGEMNERREFMKEMETLGKAHQYKNQIDAEMSQYIREMEQIDRKKQAELESLLSGDTVDNVDNEDNEEEQ